LIDGRRNGERDAPRVRACDSLTIEPAQASAGPLNPGAPSEYQSIVDRCTGDVEHRTCGRKKQIAAGEAP
jgi:hypothetical protein